MNTNAVQNVVNKLDILLKEGADFKRTRWIFNWDYRLSIEANMYNYAIELEALKSIARKGVITLEVRDNPKVSIPEIQIGMDIHLDDGCVSSFRNNVALVTEDIHIPKRKPFEVININCRLFGSPEEYWISNGKVNTQSDGAWEYINLAVWLTGFNYQLFEEIMLGNESIYTATLSVIDAIPTVRLSDRRVIVFDSLSDGMKPHKIISACLYGNFLNRLVKRDDFPSDFRLKNIKEDLRKSVFGKGKPLSPFIEVLTADTIKVKVKIRINESQLENMVKFGKLLS